MRILVFGAGVIGSIFAGKLAIAGNYVGIFILIICEDNSCRNHNGQTLYCSKE